MIENAFLLGPDYWTWEVILGNRVARTNSRGSARSSLSNLCVGSQV
jgi:hypothetical protein